MSGQALEFKQLNIHAWEVFEKGQDVHMQAAPSQAELLFKNYKVIKEKLKSKMKDAIMEKYGNAATVEELPKELIFGQTEKEVEYDRAGRVIKGMVYMKSYSFSNSHPCFVIFSLHCLLEKFILMQYIKQTDEKVAFGVCGPNLDACKCLSVYSFSLSFRNTGKQNKQNFRWVM